MLVFNDLELVVTHQRALAPKSRQTIEDHLPPHKLQMLMATPQGCLKQAEKIGPFTLKWMIRLLENRVTDRLRSGMSVLQFAKKYSPQRLENACHRSLDFDDIYYGKQIRKTSKGKPDFKGELFFLVVPYGRKLVALYGRLLTTSMEHEIIDDIARSWESGLVENHWEGQRR